MYLIIGTDCLPVLKTEVAKVTDVGGIDTDAHAGDTESMGAFAFGCVLSIFFGNLKFLNISHKYCRQINSNCN